MSKPSFPWILAGILLVAWAGWGIGGLAAASAGVIVTYLASVWLSPRTRHWRCKGTGEKRGILFTWVFRKCGRCVSGRVIRWGAGQWGSPAIRAERTRTREALAAARRAGRWR